MIGQAHLTWIEVEVWAQEVGVGVYIRRIEENSRAGEFMVSILAEGSGVAQRSDSGTEVEARRRRGRKTLLGRRKREPKVLFLDHLGVPGGAELYLLDVAQHFAPESTVLLYAAGPLRDRLEEAGISVEVIPAPASVGTILAEAGLTPGFRAGPALLQLAVATARIARQYDVLFANSQNALIVGALASRISRKPLVWNLHDILSLDHFPAARVRVLVAFANRFAGRIIANSEATRDAFGQAGGRMDRVHVVYNGIAPPDPNPGAGLAIRREFGLEGKLLIGVFSRFSVWKGQHVLIEALRDLPEVTALVCGDALSEEDRPYAERLYALVRKYHLEDRVHFPGFRDDVPALLQAVDIVVHTSTAPEPFGRAIVEGLFAGKSVVATRGGGAVEIVDHGRTGLLVDPGSPAALVAAVKRLLDDPAAAHAMAEAGRMEAERRFSPDQMIEGIQQQVRAAARK